uniref:Adaptor related protein complex 3 subunit sigma 2 n=1 Tax=Suricata suricatta TaxID=37032 RepID=A0A673TIY1_SURSU
MIQAILVFNNHGKPRLVRFYQRFPEEIQQQIVRETFHLVLKRDDNICNFLEGGSLIGGSDYKLIYRHYATLYFVFCVDSSESELGILDLIQVFVETLDKCFENVCELDLIFHMDKVHYILQEVVMGGMVLETNMNEIVAQIEAQNRLEKSEGGLSAAPARAVSAVKNINLPEIPRNINIGADGSVAVSEMMRLLRAGNPLPPAPACRARFCAFPFLSHICSVRTQKEGGTRMEGGVSETFPRASQQTPLSPLCRESHCLVSETLTSERPDLVPQSASAKGPKRHPGFLFGNVRPVDAPQQSRLSYLRLPASGKARNFFFSP